MLLLFVNADLQGVCGRIYLLLGLDQQLDQGFVGL